ncbi:2-hydroxy-3-keto-5-methylthiopentenyl-1-phosphatephosphatase [Gammaproteobacteria bacterium]
MLFVIDFDGTLSLRDSIDHLLKIYADPVWKDVEARWLAGEISAVECMHQQISMVRADRLMLDAFFSSIELDKEFLPFYHYVNDFAEVVIISDGLDHAIDLALKSSGFPRLSVIANHLSFVSDGIHIDFPHRNPCCMGGNGVCKCAVAHRLSALVGGPVVLIGDGKSDACLAKEADFVFAKNSLIDHCQRCGISYTSFSSFTDILAVVRDWPQVPSICFSKFE